MLPKTIYHYTSSFEFLGDLFQKPIRILATHKDFLNDPSELRKTTRRLHHGFKQLAKDVLDDDVLKSQLEELDHLNIFVKSFSCNKDFLPMWMAYAKHNGFAVGFNLRKMIEAINSVCERQDTNCKFPILWYKDHYHGCVALSYGKCRYAKCQISDSEWAALIESFYKNKAYCYENEFRIAILNPDAHDKVFCNIDDQWSLIGGKPRVRIHLAEDTDINEIIDEIIISPIGDKRMTKLKVDFLCKRHGFDLRKVKISKIPYQEV